MSNEANNEKMNFHLSDVDDNNPRDDDIQLPKSRLSSASKKSETQRSTIINESPNHFHENINQLNNQNLTNENQSLFDSLNHEEQQTFNDHSSSSFRDNKSINDEDQIPL